MYVYIYIYIYIYIYMEMRICVRVSACVGGCAGCNLTLFSLYKILFHIIAYCGSQ